MAKKLLRYTPVIRIQEEVTIRNVKVKKTAESAGSA